MIVRLVLTVNPNLLLHKVKRQYKIIAKFYKLAGFFISQFNFF